MSETLRKRERPMSKVTHMSGPTSKSAPVQPGAMMDARSQRPQGAHIGVRRRAADEEDVSIMSFKEYIEQKQIVDPFRDVYLAGGQLAGCMSILEPTYSPYALLRLPYENATLLQCIYAMVTNVHGHGYGFEYIGPHGQQDSDAALKEKQTLQSLVDYPNDSYGMYELTQRHTYDFENFGYAYMEVGRDGKGQITMMAHIPAHTMRCTVSETTPIAVQAYLPRDGSIKPVKVRKSFRRFCQIVGSRRIWFKEFGDPRPINPETGLVDETLALEDTATEIIFFSQYYPGSPYGMPRWFNQLPAVLGSRQAELTNLDFFQDNAIPAMMLLVSGGMITQASIDTIDSHVFAAKGRKSMNRMLILEAQGDQTTATPDGSIPIPKIEVKPLQSERQGDALFQNYENSAKDKIRSSFRMPPLFVGMSEDMTYATARTSYEVAETQIFRPERNRFDMTLNLKILSTYNPKFWAFRSNPPKLTDPDALVEALKSFDAVGALTPNVAISLANKFFAMDIDTIKAPWGSFPFPLVMASYEAGKLSVKGLDNQQPPAPAAPAGPPKPGQNGDDTAEPAAPSEPSTLNKPQQPKPAAKKPAEGAKTTTGKTTTGAGKGNSGKVKKKDDTGTAVREILSTLRDAIRAGEAE